MPNPLPPSLNWDGDLAQATSNADRALGELAGIARWMPNPDLLASPLLRREAVLSSRIEGTQADIADLYAFEAEAARPTRGPVPVRADTQEVFNYLDSLKYGLERVKTLPLSLRFIRELHELLMTDVRGEYATPGEFRRSPNWIGPPGCSLNDATFVPPPVAEMSDALNDFESYLHADSEYPPLIRLAFIHYQFEAIHPFLDGNGRIGRLLMSLLIAHWELLPAPLLHLSAFFERNRDDYYRLLFNVSLNGDWLDWILFFLKGVAEQSEDAVGRAKRLQDLQQVWRDRLTTARASALPLRLVDQLFELPYINAGRAAAVLGVTKRTAILNLRKLEAAGILELVEGSSTSGYSRQYIAQDIVRIAGD